MPDAATMTSEQIKAEMFDLHYHCCDGRASVPPAADDRSCSMCSRYQDLNQELQRRSQPYPIAAKLVN